MGSLTTLYLIGGAGLFFGAIIWYALRQARKKGVAEQVARDLKTVTDAESQIHEVQAEQRDTSTTKEKLKRGDF